MCILKEGDYIGIVACSNGLSVELENKLTHLVDLLSSLNIKVKLSPYIYKKNNIFNGTDKEKADILHTMFIDNTIKAIFDISGGDLSNGLLNHLDFNLIASKPKAFFGYSDLSVLLNSLYSQSNINTYYYQLRNLVSEDSHNQISYFQNSILNNSKELFDFKYKWVQGNSMEGIVVGGNLRCTLKLAGTKFMPNFNNKILFLESLGGDVAKIYTALNQYKQIGAFDNLNGIILGEFTEMDGNNYNPTVVELLTEILNNPLLPIVKTKELGHSNFAKSIIIGKSLKITKELSANS